MAISKGSLAAGILGTGGGAVGTVATVKYVTSKEESGSKENSETRTAQEEVSSPAVVVAETPAMVDPLKEIKGKIENWIKEDNRSCKIKVVLEGDNEEKELSEISGEDKKEKLEKLHSDLNSSNPKSDAVEKCKDGKTLIAKNNSDKWSFDLKD